VDSALERVGACDHDDLVEPAHVLEHGREEQPLLRGAEPRRRSRGEDDGGDH
jgi:hypothetical protein